MGTTRSIAIGVRELPATAGLAAVRAVRQIAEREARVAVGADRRMSNVGRRGARLGVRDDFTKSKGTGSVTITATPQGPWSWVTFGTGAHVIGAGRASRRTGNYSQTGFAQRKLISFGPDQVVVGPVFHPGQMGKGSWTKVRRSAARVVPKIFETELHKIMG